jgi:hypothetical protein
MTGVLLVVLVATAIVVGVGIFLTLRGFKAADRPADAAPVPTKPNSHDAATTAQLKRFFEGKHCAACSRSIPPVHLGEPRPGLLNASTREAIAWNEIPAANLPATLESHVPICSNCLLVETIGRQHPDLVVDRRRTLGHPTH